jgi:pyruvate-formate lyase-activating enzyme
MSPRKPPPREPPRLLMADAGGRIFEHPLFRMLGSSGRTTRAPLGAELIPVPPGTDLFVMPGRSPVGLDPRTGRATAVTHFAGEPVSAVAAFLPPAWTAHLWCAFTRSPGAPILPLYAYAAAGWRDGRVVTTATRVDPDRRQDLLAFPEGEAEDNARMALEGMPGNRLVRHLTRCCLEYRCPAARNYFLGRWEAPLPTSPACNARCLGCLSLQGEDGPVSTQQRIAFSPTAREISEVAVPHLERAPRPVVSFGQGCEGEPLLQGALLEQSVELIRRQTARGTINLNTNGSRPEVLGRLFAAGLDSVRVSLNSARPELYTRYFRPVDYSFAEVVESLSLARRVGKFCSVNYFVFPGFTDEQEEVEAFEELLSATGAHMIQWRNLNIDPDWYMDTLEWQGGRAIGIGKLLARIRKRFPAVRFGYFNPCLDPEMDR